MLLSLNLYLYIHITNTEPSYVVYMEQYKQVAAQKSLTLIHWDKMADLRAAQEQEKFALVLLKWREPIITSGRMRRELDVAWRIEAYGMNLGDWNILCEGEIVRKNKRVRPEHFFETNCSSIKRTLQYKAFLNALLRTEYGG